VALQVLYGMLASGPNQSGIFLYWSLSLATKMSEA
jgi:hypothetical protein